MIHDTDTLLKLCRKACEIKNREVADAILHVYGYMESVCMLNAETYLPPGLEQARMLLESAVSGETQYVQDIFPYDVKADGSAIAEEVRLAILATTPIE